MLNVDDAKRNIPEILNRYEVESVEASSPTLNDVFLKLTGRSIKEQRPKAVLWRGMCNMTNIRIYSDKIYALWLREVKVFFREKSRLVASTFTPLLWLFVIGSGFGSSTSMSMHL